MVLVLVLVRLDWELGWMFLSLEGQLLEDLVEVSSLVVDREVAYLEDHQVVHLGILVQDLLVGQVALVRLNLVVHLVALDQLDQEVHLDQAYLVEWVHLACLVEEVDQVVLELVPLDQQEVS